MCIGNQLSYSRAGPQYVYSGPGIHFAWFIEKVLEGSRI